MYNRMHDVSYMYVQNRVRNIIDTITGEIEDLVKVT